MPNLNRFLREFILRGQTKGGKITNQNVSDGLFISNLAVIIECHKGKKYHDFLTREYKSSETYEAGFEFDCTSMVLNEYDAEEGKHDWDLSNDETEELVTEALSEQYGSVVQPGSVIQCNESVLAVRIFKTVNDLVEYYNYVTLFNEWKVPCDVIVPSKHSTAEFSKSLNQWQISHIHVLRFDEYNLIISEKITSAEKQSEATKYLLIQSKKPNERYENYKLITQPTFYDFLCEYFPNKLS